MKKIKRAMAMVLALVLCIGVIGVQKPAEAEAASSSKWSRLKFIISTVDAMVGNCNNAGHKVTKLKVNADSSVTYTDNGDKVASAKVNSIKKKYSTSLENAQKLAVAADMGIFKTTSPAFKSAKKMKAKITYKTALQVLTAADEYLNGKTLSDDDLKAIKKRISNIKKAGTSGYQTIMMKGFGLGIYVGENDGAYSRTRNLKYSSKLSEKTCKKLIKKLTDTSARTEFTDDWQALKKKDDKDYPVTADLYPYILESFPAAYYDTAWRHYSASNDDTYEGSDYYKYQHMSFDERKMLYNAFIWPCELKKWMELPDSECGVNSKYRDWKFIEDSFKDAVEYYTLAMNVDYRTIRKDTEWRKAIGKYLREDYIEEYIDNCEKYKIIVECDVVAGDPSAAYQWVGYYHKLYLHFRVLSDTELEKGGRFEKGHGELVPCLNAAPYGGQSRGYLQNFFDYKVGEWIDYYVSPEVGNFGRLDCCTLVADIMLNDFGLYPNLVDGGM